MLEHALARKIDCSQGEGTGDLCVLIELQDGARFQIRRIAGKRDRRRQPACKGIGGTHHVDGSQAIDCDPRPNAIDSQVATSRSDHVIAGIEIARDDVTAGPQSDISPPCGTVQYDVATCG